MSARTDALSYIVDQRSDTPRLGVGDQNRPDHVVRAEWVERMRIIALARYLLKKSKPESDYILKRMENRHGEASIRPIVKLMTSEARLKWQVDRALGAMRAVKECPAERSKATAAINSITAMMNRHKQPQNKTVSPEPVKTRPAGPAAAVFGNLGLRPSVSAAKATTTTAAPKSTEAHKRIDELRKNMGGTPATPEPVTADDEPFEPAHAMSAF